jgi:hypothetical protein
MRREIFKRNKLKERRCKINSTLKMKRRQITSKDQNTPRPNSKAFCRIWRTSRLSLTNIKQTITNTGNKKLINTETDSIKIIRNSLCTSFFMLSFVTLQYELLKVIISIFLSYTLKIISLPSPFLIFPSSICFIWIFK